MARIWLCLVLLVAIGIEISFTGPCSSQERAIVQTGKESPLCIDYSPDGKLLAIGGHDKKVVLWDVDGKCVQARKIESKFAIHGVRFSPDGKTLGVGTAEAGGVIFPLVLLYDVATLKERQYFVRVGVFAFSPDGTKLAGGGVKLDHDITIWDVNTGKELGQLKGHKEHVCAMCYAPDGKKLATGDWKGTLILWDMETQKAIRSWQGSTQEIRTIAFSPNSKSVAHNRVPDFTEADLFARANMYVWDVENGKRTLAPLSGGAIVIQWTPDGKRIAVGAADLELLDAATGKSWALFQSSTGQRSYPVHAMAIRPDGKMIATVGSDKLLRIWEVPLKPQPRDWSKE